MGDEPLLAHRLGRPGVGRSGARQIPVLQRLMLASYRWPPLRRNVGGVSLWTLRLRARAFQFIGVLSNLLIQGDNFEHGSPSVIVVHLWFHFANAAYRPACSESRLRAGHAPCRCAIAYKAADEPPPKPDPRQPQGRDKGAAQRSSLKRRSSGRPDRRQPLSGFAL